MNNDLISRSELTKELRERLVACNDWEEKAKDNETRIRANAVKTFICEMFMLLKEFPTVEPEPYFEKAEKDKRIYERGFEDGQNARPQGKCRTCRHRDPEDKKCDCGGKERQGCPFPVSDDYFCKFYEKGGTE